MTNRPVPLMEDFLGKDPRALGETGQFKYLGGKAHRDVIPYGRVAAYGSVQVARALSLKSPHALHSLVC